MIQEDQRYAWNIKEKVKHSTLKRYALDTDCIFVLPNVCSPDFSRIKEFKLTFGIVTCLNII